MARSAPASRTEAIESDHPSDEVEETTSSDLDLSVNHAKAEDDNGLTRSLEQATSESESQETNQVSDQISDETSASILPNKCEEHGSI